MSRFVNALRRLLGMEASAAREEAKLMPETPSLADAVPAAGMNPNDLLGQVIEQRERYARENNLGADELIDLRSLLAEAMGVERTAKEPEREERENEQEMER